MITLVARRALLDYVRRPLNVVLLVAVPVVIVVALSGELAALSKLLSTAAEPLHLDLATAGWAAAAVAGLAGFFQVVGSRDSDRRLAVVSTKGATPVIVGRLVASAGLALAAAAAAIAALAVKGGVADPARAIPAVVLVSIMYVAIGVLTGTLVRSEMNGALVVSVIWMLDVFVGSGLGGNSSLVARVFPLHFPTMILTSQAAHHGGPIGDVGWSLMWTAVLSGLAVARLASVTRSARRGRTAPLEPAASLEVPLAPATTGEPPPADGDLARAPVLQPTVESPSAGRPRRMSPWRPAAGLWADVRQYSRSRVLWVLLAAVPALFVAMAAVQTPTTLVPVSLIDGARHITAMISMRQIHAGEMAGVASALLAGIAGLFVVTGSAAGDRRLVLAGFRPRQVLAGHLGVIAGAALATTAVSLAVSALFFSPQLWVEYAGAGLLIALTYAMIGVLLGPLTGRLGGLYVILLLAIVDTGYGQTVMFHPLPPTWGAFLPARGAGRLLLDGSFTPSFEQYGSLALALAWLAGLTAAAVIVFKVRIGAKSARPLAPDLAVPLGEPASAAWLRSSLYDDASTVSCLLHGSEGTWRTKPSSQDAHNMTATNPPPTAADEQWLQLELEDGRILEVVICGQGSGAPVVFHNGSPTAAVPFGPLTAAAARQGSPVVTWSRPGYATSTPQPGRNVAAVIADTAAALDAIEAESFVTIGWSSGGPYALACAALLAGRCRAAATLGGLGPYGAPGLDWLAGRGPESVIGFDAAKGGEGPLTPLLELVAPSYSQVLPDTVATTLGGILSEVDKGALTGEFSSYMAAVIRRALSTGVVGWRDDVLGSVGDWGFDLRAIAVPVAVWHGAEDRMVPVAHRHWLAHHIPGSIAHLYANQGHLSLAVGRIGQVVDYLFDLAGFRIAVDATNPGDNTQRRPREKVN